MTVNIGHLYKKRTVRNLRGEIVDLIDQTNGGVIISKGRVVNQEYIDDLARKEEDRKTAAVAFAAPAEAPVGAPVEERKAAPGKIDNLEKRVGDMEGNINKILDLLQNK